MKKIVSIIFTLFTVVLGVNAQMVTINKKDFVAITSKGSDSYNFSTNLVNISLSSDFKKVLNKGIARDAYDRLLLRTNGTSKVSISISLTDAAKAIKSKFGSKSLCIKKVEFDCATQYCFAGFNLSHSSLSLSPSGFTCILNNDYAELQSVSLDKLIDNEIAINSINVYLGFLYDEEFVLSDASEYPFSTDSIYARTVKYTRDMPTSKWGTLVLPFSFSPTSNVMVYNIDDFQSNTFKFHRVSNNVIIKAGESVVYCIPDNLTKLEIVENDVLISSAAFSNGISTEDKKTFESNQQYTIYGSLKNISLDSSVESGYFIAQNKFYPLSAKKTVNIKPYRAWVSSFSGTSLAGARPISLDGFDFENELLEENLESTSIIDIYNDETQTIYNANGVVIPELQKGLNIIKTANGVKKVFVR